MAIHEEMLEDGTTDPTHRTSSSSCYGSFFAGLEGSLMYFIDVSILLVFYIPIMFMYSQASVYVWTCTTTSETRISFLVFMATQL